MPVFESAYDEYWRKHPHVSLGPGQWSRDYHGKPNLDFQHLCDVAESRGMSVGLTVGNEVHPVRDRKGEKIGEYRRLAAIVVGPTGKRGRIIKFVLSKTIYAKFAEAARMARDQLVARH